MEHVHILVTAEWRPRQKVPGIVKGGPWEREHRRLRDIVQAEVLPGRLHLFAGMSRYDRLDGNAECDEIGRQICGVAPDATGRRRQELLYVECDPQ
jgi:hypothetical protein